MLRDRMQANAYTRQNGIGFRLTTVRDTEIEGVFSEKLQYSQSVFDPYGDEVIIKRVEFKDVRFRISPIFPQLELLDPPRSLKLFLSKIAEYLEFKVVIEQIEVDPLDWIDAVDEEKSLAVTSILLSNVTISNEVLGVIRLTGSSDVRSHVRKIVGSRRYAISQAVCASKYKPSGFEVEVFSTAKLRILNGTSESILPHFRRSLPRHAGTPDEK